MKIEFPAPSQLPDRIIEGPARAAEPKSKRRVDVAVGVTDGITVLVEVGVIVFVNALVNVTVGVSVFSELNTSSVGVKLGVYVASSEPTDIVSVGRGTLVGVSSSLAAGGSVAVAGGGTSTAGGSVASGGSVITMGGSVPSAPAAPLKVLLLKSHEVKDNDRIMIYTRRLKALAENIRFMLLSRRDGCFANYFSIDRKIICV